jgi:YgiT-type zinc finger domain-containing protein
MTQKRKQNDSKVCSQCGAPELREVRRTRVHQGIVIENIPATFCPNCGEELYDLATVQLIEQIVAAPEVYAPLLERRSGARGLAAPSFRPAN